MRIALTNPDLRYLECTPAGAEYARQITANEPDRRTRAAFQDLVLAIASPGARLFDFGAGPGIDARFFAGRGFTVDAYDVDPRMREFFVEHCADFIATGRIVLEHGSYRDFVAPAPAGQAGQAGRADLVIADFAPLNLIDDLHELFGKFAALTGPQGKVLASVLNPCLLAELRHRAWWRNAPQLWRDGEWFMPGPQAPHYRRLLRHFRAVSAPHFRLCRIFRGLPPARAVHGWLQAARCRYLFVLFEKTHRQ